MIAHGAAKALYDWSAAPIETGVRLERRPGRCWPPAPGRPTQSSDTLGALGVAIATQWLRETGRPDAQCVRSVLPIDALTRTEAVEVKSGLVTNSPKAQHWRLTLSARTREEKAAWRTITKADKRTWLGAKQSAIAHRKADLLSEIQAVLGRPLVALTVGLIFDLEFSRVDFFAFAGWHQRIPWSSAHSRAGFCGSFSYRVI